MARILRIPWEFFLLGLISVLTRGPLRRSSCRTTLMANQFPQFHERIQFKEATMFRKLAATSDDPVMTILRLVLGIVFFFHGAQKMLGWFGGYGFSGSMNFFTHQMGIPAVFAFLAITAEFFGSLGLIVGLLARV